MIHNQHAMPFPNDIGVLANPGEVLSVGVRKVPPFDLLEVMIQLVGSAISSYRLL